MEPHIFLKEAPYKIVGFSWFRFLPLSQIRRDFDVTEHLHLTRLDTVLLCAAYKSSAVRADFRELLAGPTGWSVQFPAAPVPKGSKVLELRVCGVSIFGIMMMVPGTLYCAGYLDPERWAYSSTRQGFRPRRCLVSLCRAYSTGSGPCYPSHLCLLPEI